MNLSDYLFPLSNSRIPETGGEFCQQLHFNHGEISLEKLNKGDVVFVGIPYQMNKKLEHSESADLVRQELYQLAGREAFKNKIVDAGDLRQGKNVKETLHSLKNLLDLLNGQGAFTLLIGGSALFNLGILMHLESVLGRYTYTLVEPWFSLAEFVEYGLVDFNLLNYYNLGNQSYYLTKPQKEWLRKYQYEALRLGRMRGYLEETEPYLRNSNGCSISIHALKNSEAPAQKQAHPNGLYNEEVCQLARYAGIAGNLSVFGIFDYFPPEDKGRVTARLIAQMFWFAIDGYQIRYPEHPYSDNHFQKFLVSMDDHNITFYKSERTSRWWMEIPHKDRRRNQVYPCNQSDYDTACRHEIPERWLLAYQKLNFHNF
jgi:arginase family enzyme